MGPVLWLAQNCTHTLVCQDAVSVSMGMEPRDLLRDQPPGHTGERLPVVRGDTVPEGKLKPQPGFSVDL